MHGPFARGRFGINPVWRYDRQGRTAKAGFATGLVLPDMLQQLGRSFQ